MKTKDLIIAEIESKFSNQYDNLLIGFRGYPQSKTLLHANGIDLIYGENCISENDAEQIVNHFVNAGMELDNRFSLNIAKGVYIIKK